MTASGPGASASKASADPGPFFYHAWRPVSTVLLTKRIEFAAAHRYHKDSWDAARNRAIFGACNNAPGHGHNYLLEVTVTGKVDEHTGMVVNLFDLKRVLKEVLEEFDHKHLNYDTAYFKEIIPTTENLAGVFWRILASCPEIGRLDTVRLYEDEDLFAEIRGANGSVGAGMTRRYQFSAGHRLHSDRLSEGENQRVFGKCHNPSGHNYDLFVTVSGAIDPETGMVVEVPALDRLVHQLVVERFDHRDLSQDPAFSGLVATGENVVKIIWDLLVRSLPGGRLERVKLVETRDTYFEYAGESTG